MSKVPDPTPPPPSRFATDPELAAFIARLSYLDRYDWPSHARPQQLPPPSYRTLILRAGRGGGKTRAAAEEVRTWVTRPPTDGARAVHIAVLASGHREVRDLCFEHPRSGLLAVIPPELITDYRKGLGDNRLHLQNGSTIRGFSAQEPDSIRGYAFDGLWFDEYASWPAATAQDMYDQAWFTLRETTNPRCVITTTPKRNRHMIDLMRLVDAFTDPTTNEERHVSYPDLPIGAELPDGTLVPTPTTYLRVWHTMDNSQNLSPVAMEQLLKRYEGTRLGLQELGGQMLEEVDGALWTLAEIAACTWPTLPQLEPHDPPVPTPLPPLTVIVTAVDPSGSPGGDMTGIVTSGLDAAGVIYVLADASLGGPAQTRYERACYEAYRHGSSIILYESAYGGDNVALGISNAWRYLTTDVGLIPTDHPRPRIVPSTLPGDKATRAEPCVALFQQQLNTSTERIYLLPNLTPLIEEMTQWDPAAVPATKRSSANMTRSALGTSFRMSSPNRIDALVHGVRYLMRRAKRAQGEADISALDTYGQYRSLQQPGMPGSHIPPSAQSPGHGPIPATGASPFAPALRSRRRHVGFTSPEPPPASPLTISDPDPTPSTLITDLDAP